MAGPDTRSSFARRAHVLLTLLLAGVMIAAGVAHFVTPEPFVGIVPNVLPAPRTLVLVSGVFEILGGAGLLIPHTRKAAAWGLIALYVAVFPANINMAVNGLPFGDHPPDPVLAWLRLPFQAVFIAWAWYVGRLSREPASAASA